MRLPKSSLLLVIATILVISAKCIGQDGVPMLINYQGELRSPTTGDPIPDGSYEMLFRIYDVESGGTLLWEEVHSSLYDGAVAVTNGLFSVVLGTGTGDPLDASILDGDERWLEIRIGTETLSPRQRMTSTAYSIISEHSHLLGGKAASDFADAAHAHSADDITSGVLPDERIDSVVTRDSELSDAIAGHTTAADAHHTKTTSFTELTDAATDAQIPDGITISYAARAGDADTVDGMEAHDLEESAEIDTAITDHAAITDAHHSKTTSFTELTDSASDFQIPDSLARDAEVGTAIATHAAVAEAHHTKTSSFAELADTAADAQIPGSIARDSEIMPTVLVSDGSGSTLDADLLDGMDSAGFAPVSHTHDAGDLASGTVDNDRFSAYGDLSAEGYMDNNADEDLLTRAQTDGRYWKLSGNSGTGGTANFLGTTDSTALEFRVGNSRALRIEPQPSPNLIGGVSDNRVTSGVMGAVIGGGGSSSMVLDLYNSVTDGYGTVAGGMNNHVGDDMGTTVDKSYGAVGGGGHNRARGLASTVSGGWTNWASGDYATVSGGSDNRAGGQYSFAAGRRAKIAQDHHGAFLFADHLEYDFNSAGADEFAVRATGGVRFVSEVGTGGDPGAGVVLKPGDSQWQNLSDRDAKENLVPVDGKAALARLLALPLSTWNYKAQDPSIRHMGPMAQDFHAAFGLGNDERYIGSLDANGVALAAIQGLYEIVWEKDVRILSLEQRNADLEGRLKALESLVEKLTDKQ